MLLVVFALIAGHWEFNRIEHINSFDSAKACQYVADITIDKDTMTYCMEDAGIEI